MLDLTHVKWLPNRFGGSESKWTMLYDDKLYMVKFPDPNRAPKQTSLPYINNHFSEYVGCHIFQMLGISAQNTFLGACHSAEQRKRKACRGVRGLFPEQRRYSHRVQQVLFA